MNMLNNELDYLYIKYLFLYLLYNKFIIYKLDLI